MCNRLYIIEVACRNLTKEEGDNQPHPFCVPRLARKCVVIGFETTLFTTPWKHEKKRSGPSYLGHSIVSCPQSPVPNLMHDKVHENSFL